jgi:hypothetical protein
MYFLFCGAASGSSYALSELKGSPFGGVYGGIITIGREARTLFSDLELYGSLFEFGSSVSIVLGSIATSSLRVLRFALGLVPQLELPDMLRPRSLSIPY